jgi:hypothetical protein
MLKAVIGEIELEVWFTPSFNIKTNSKQMEQLLRNAEFTVFDPWLMTMRKTKATKSIESTYLVLEQMSITTGVKVKYKETPELPSHYDLGTEENPVLH